MIGKLLRKVDFNTTAVIVWGDNGYSLGSPNGIVGKKTLFREVTSTPLMVRWPALLPAGERKDPVESLDILPTIAEIAGIPMLPSWAGRTLTNMTDRTQALTSGDLWGPRRQTAFGIARNTANSTTTTLVFLETKNQYTVATRTTLSYQMDGKEASRAMTIVYTNSTIEFSNVVDKSWLANVVKTPQWHT